jgi:hypothetical protein
MNLKLLDVVVMCRDLPQHGIVSGDMGAVVEIHEPDGVEVEFVSGSGRTLALATLNVADVRLVGEDDIPSVRSLTAA